MSTRARQPRANGGLNPSTIAMGVLVVVLAAVATLWFFTEKPQGDAAGTGAGAEEQEPVDPFEGLPPEKPPSEQKGER